MPYSLQNYEEELRRIETKLETNAEMLRRNELAVDEIRRSLVGDELRPTSGLIVRIAELEAAVQENTEARKRIKWLAVGATGFATVLSTVIGWFVGR